MLHRVRSPGLPRPGLLALQLASVGVSGVLLAAIGLVGLRVLGDGVEHANLKSEAALLTAAIDHSTDYVDLLIASNRSADGIAFTPAITARVYAQIRVQQDGARRLAEVDSSADVTRLQELTEAKELAFLRFVESGSAADFAAMHEIHIELNELVQRLAPERWRAAQLDARDAARLSGVASIGVFLAGVSVLALLTITTYLISRRVRSMLQMSERERQSLALSAISIERRTEQFRALYQVAAESADEIDASRVAESVARSALRLLRAELAVVWLADEGGLHIAGVDAAASWIGQEGLPGDARLPRRVSGRGRSLLMGPNAESDIGDTGVEGAESGVMAPIISNSRIIAVVGCWSVEAGAFDEDDRRLLEMLAAQVAPAIAAADSFEASEARAHTDALTGLANRRQLERDLTTRFADAGSRDIAVAMLDLDHFKRFNDTYGHAAGDVALQLVSRVLLSNCRNRDMVYRFGGEEFAMIMDGASTAQAVAALDRILLDVRHESRTDPRVASELTLAAGVAAAPEHGRDLALLLERADQALYAAKAAGRARVATWPDSHPSNRAA